MRRFARDLFLYSSGNLSGKPIFTICGRSVRDSWLIQQFDVTHCFRSFMIFSAIVILLENSIALFLRFRPCYFFGELPPGTRKTSIRCLTALLGRTSCFAPSGCATELLVSPVAASLRFESRIGCRSVAKISTKELTRSSSDLLPSNGAVRTAVEGVHWGRRRRPVSITAVLDVVSSSGGCLPM